MHKNNKKKKTSKQLPIKWCRAEVKHSLFEKEHMLLICSTFLGGLGLEQHC
jgi:hypothetical protein